MKKISLGVDIEEVVRFQRLLRNKRFLHRVFTPQEIAYCNSKKNRVQHFAVRFAAKEAVWKAMSDELRRSKSRLGHKDIGLKNDRFGRPEVVLHKGRSSWARHLSVSLSHSRAYVVAVVTYSR